MVTEFNNSLISDITPRPRAQRQRLESSFASHRLDYYRLMDDILPSVQPGRPAKRVLSHWSPKYIGGLIGLLAILLLVIGGRSNRSAPLYANAISPNRQVEAKQVIVNYGLPARLRIPKLNVDTLVEHLGLTAKAEMAAPKESTQTGWFKLGPRPGEIGSSVITGHYGYKDRVAAVFDNLHELKPGDKLYVDDEKGATTTFIVRESRSYDPKADAADVFGASDGKAHLNLITCLGTWNKSQKSYSNRLVVFADKE